MGFTFNFNGSASGSYSPEADGRSDQSLKVSSPFCSAEVSNDNGTAGSVRVYQGPTYDVMGSYETDNLGNYPMTEDEIPGGITSCSVSITFSGQIRANMLYSLSDPEMPNPDGSLGTPNGRPNHLRQITGVWHLSYVGNVEWTAAASMDAYYTIWPWDAEAPTGTRAVNMDVDMAGPTDWDGDSADDSGGPPSVRLAYSSYAVPGSNYTREQVGTMTGSLTVNGYTMDPQFGTFWTGTPGTASGPSTSDTLNLYDGLDWSYTDEFVVYPSWRGSMDADSEEWDGTAVTLRVKPVFPNGPATADTPWNSGTQTVRNVTGPGWYYQPEPIPGQPVNRLIISAFYDATAQRNQQHYTGENQAAYLIPPDDDSASWDAFTIGLTGDISLGSVATDVANTALQLGGDANAYYWNASALLTIAQSGAFRSVVASDTGGTLSRALLSDLRDISAQPSDYRDHASCPADIAAYIETRRQWYNIRKRIRSGSDVFNWQNRRYLKIAGYATGSAPFGRTLTLRLHADFITVSDNFTLGPLDTDSDAPGLLSDRNIDLTFSSGTVDIPITLPDTSGAVYVDLAEAAERLGYPLYHVNKIEFRDFETGGTYYLGALTLTGKDGASPVWGYWSGVPYAGDEGIVCVVDGLPGTRAYQDEQCGFAIPWVNHWVDISNNSVVNDRSPRGADETKTLAELVQEINFNEGLTATLNTVPAAWTHMAWAIFMDNEWHSGGGACQVTIKAANMDVPVGLYHAWQADGIVGGILLGLAWDNATTPYEPAGAETVTIEGHAHTGSYVSMGSITTDSQGGIRTGALPQAGRGPKETELDGDPDENVPVLPGSYFTDYRLRAPGLDVAGQPATATANVHNTGVKLTTLMGEAAQPPADGTGSSVLVTPMGWVYRAWEESGNVRVDRLTRPGGPRPVIAEKAGSMPALIQYRDGGIGVLYVAGTDSIHEWKLDGGTDVVVGTGTYPQARWNADRTIRVETRWRSGHTYVVVKDQFGTAINGGEVDMGATTEGPAPVDFLLDGRPVVQLPTASGIDEVVSNDNGRTWA